MAEPPSLFHRSIAHALSSWPALATCVRMGAGGRESAEKAEWLIGATEQWMTENQGIEPEELAEFYQDVLWNEFDMVVDDGSLSESFESGGGITKVVEKFSYAKEGGGAIG